MAYGAIFLCTRAEARWLVGSPLQSSRTDLTGSVELDSGDDIKAHYLPSRLYQ